MIRRALIAAAALLAVYHLVLPHLPRGWSRAPGQQRQNYLRAQHYVHDVPSETNVIVGSSMSNELNEQLLGRSLCKLTFPGGSMFTGLELIRGSDHHPRVVLIESNVLLREADRELVDNTLSTWRRSLRKHSPVFRESGRPSSFAIGLLHFQIRDAARAWDHWRAKNDALPAEVRPDRTLTPRVFEQIMAENRHALRRSPAPDELRRSANRLVSLVNELTADGCRCLFFEMPIDSSLAHLPEPDAVRRVMHERFPESRFTWIEFPHDHPYRTVDGIHLTRPDADLVSRELAVASGDAMSAPRIASVR